jgi:hypothetical protein
MATASVSSISHKAGEILHEMREQGGRATGKIHKSETHRVALTGLNVTETQSSRRVGNR